MLQHPFFTDTSGYWKKFIESHPLALLIHQHEGTFYATHLPMILMADSDGRLSLAGHLPLKNPQALLVRKRLHAMAIFATPSAYVSGTWYEVPGVSTMNYEAVHIQGIVSETSYERLVQILHAMNQRLEYLYNPEQPLRLHELSANYLESQYKNLLGFELRIEKVETTRKLSQNKSGKDRASIISYLKKRGRPEDIVVSEAMDNL